MTALSEFQALKTLIVSSLDRYEAALGAGGISEPHLAAAKPHESMDAPGYLPSHELYDTTNTLVSALGQMRALVMSPADRLIKTTLSVSAALCPEYKRQRLTVAKRHIPSSRSVSLCSSTSRT